MAGITIARPASAEYVPYFARYVDLVPEGDILDLLRRQVDETAALVGTLSDRDADYRYAEGKWSIKEVIGHLADAERIFLYRALCFARGEPKELPGWDENEYVARAAFGARALADLVAELKAARAASVSLYAGLDQEELLRKGTANQRGYSVRAVAYITAGHERHHCDIIRERYLPGLKKR
ncbi:MAG TPA: DinB family protein [Gemmatimonadales bacterium]|nr:DinB family protein [Gemmatimonadales bacterium]